MAVLPGVDVLEAQRHQRLAVVLAGEVGQLRDDGVGVVIEPQALQRASGSRSAPSRPRGPAP
jgi:hypothetical protein